MTFKPGKSGNPLGRPALPPEIRAERKKNQANLIQLVARHWALTEEEASQRMAGPGITRLEEAVYRQIERAVRDGDLFSFKYMVEIMTGKIPEQDDEPLSDEEIQILTRAREILAEKRAKPV